MPVSSFPSWGVQIYQTVLFLVERENMILVHKENKKILKMAFFFLLYIYIYIYIRGYLNPLFFLVHWFNRPIYFILKIKQNWIAIGKAQFMGVFSSVPVFLFVRCFQAVDRFCAFNSQDTALLSVDDKW